MMSEFLEFRKSHSYCFLVWWWSIILIQYSCSMWKGNSLWHGSTISNSRLLSWIEYYWPWKLILYWVTRFIINSMCLMVGIWLIVYWGWQSSWSSRTLLSWKTHANKATPKYQTQYASHDCEYSCWYRDFSFTDLSQGCLSQQKYNCKQTCQPFQSRDRSSSCQWIRHNTISICIASNTL